MVNGRAWTVDEHNDLVRTLDERGSLEALAQRNSRSLTSVLSRAKRTGLYRVRST